MEVILAALLCVIGFLIYLLNKSKDEIFTLKNEINRLRTQNSAEQIQPQINENTFVRVIFKKNDTKYYDYLLGETDNVRVGDFVEVYASNKFIDEPEPQQFIAQVIYISAPGEVSEFAKSKIKRKSNRNKW